MVLSQRAHHRRTGESGYQEQASTRRLEGDLMYSRPFFSISCLSVMLWLSFFLIGANAQQDTGEPFPHLDKIGSEVSKLRDQAGRGNAMAQYQLGRLYLSGTGVSSNSAEAATYLRLAAEQGLVDAEVLLGYLYENGTGVPRDYRRAVDYYASAASRGDLTAANNLG